MCLRSATRPLSLIVKGAGVGLRRQRACGRRRRLGAGQAVGGAGGEPVLDVDFGDDGDAVLGERFVAAGMVAMKMRVDEIFDRLVRNRRNRGLDLVMQRRELAVDHDDPVFRHRHGDVSALAFEHIDVVAEIGGLDLDLGEIRRRRCGRRLLLRDGGPGQQHHGGDNSHSGPKHRNLPCALIFRFSSTGLLVCASCEPRASLLECGSEPSGAGYKMP